MEEFSIKDILTILKQRRKYFFVTASFIFVITMYVALSWSKYRSTATVQIEESYVPANITTQAGSNANDAVGALVSNRINHIEQKVTSLESLAAIISKYNLYQGTAGNIPMSRLTEIMRKKIKLELVDSITPNPLTPMKETAEQLSAITFSLSFEYSDPEITQQVVTELVNRFADEDLKQRRLQAQETSAFLASQITQIEGVMAQQEKTIAEFRAKHGESGQAALTFNQQANITTTMSLQNIDSQIAANEGTQGNLKAQLATIEPYSRVLADGQVMTTPAVQLKALESQYATLTAQYGPDHPDVIKARHQIESLKAQIGDTESSAQLQSKITGLQTSLATLQKTYGPEHPDIVSLKDQIHSLEERLVAQPENNSSTDIIKHDADNPAYLQISAQLMSAQEQHKSLLSQRDALAGQQEQYAKSIAGNPAADQEMAKLARDYDNEGLRYRELKEKKMSADMMEQLEQGQKGQRLVVINPPDIPDTTHPPRMFLILGSIVGSIATGLFSIMLAELTNKSIHSATHLSSLVGAMPLVVVPYIYTELEANHPLRRCQSVSGVAESLAKLYKAALRKK